MADTSHLLVKLNKLMQFNLDYKCGNPENSCEYRSDSAKYPSSKTFLIHLDVSTWVGLEVGTRVLRITSFII